MVQHRTDYQCCDCGHKYLDQQNLNNHCCDCDVGFRTSQDLEKHFRTSKKAHHQVRINVPRAPAAQPTTTPTPSSKTKSPQNSTPTPNSKAKSPKKKLKKKAKPRNIPCPTGGKCQKKFAMLSAVVNHLESGRCPSGMTRVELNKLIMTHDKNRYITHEVATSAATWESPSTVLLGLPGEVLTAAPPEDSGAVPPPAEYEDSFSEWSDIGGLPLLTPSTSEADIDSEWSLISGMHTPLSNTGNPSLRTAGAPQSKLSLHCPMCPTTPNKRTFHSIRALQTHMSSLAHAPKIFHCPFTFPAVGSDLNSSGDSTSQKKKKKKQTLKYFKSLGGLATHMENGACKGGVEMFMEATRYVEEEIKKMGFVEIKLLG
ncbi:MAG: hypothetical protein M1839_004894 [Geoglossum umbratile]|nr:MAG: hypothetical protein M1839_004894 [Geoglossum umbratile]